MIRPLLPTLLLVTTRAPGQVRNFKPVTQRMLENLPAEDWLMFTRIYDAQRFTPLKQITNQNVGQLRMAWSRGIGAGHR